MNRVTVLSGVLVRDLFRSLAGIVPLAVALAFGLIAFEYGMDQAQFVTVAGVGTGGLGLLTALLLASRANRGWFYPLIARLKHRSEVLAALVLGGLAITTLLAGLITAGNLAADRLSLDFPSALWILPTWLAAWLLGLCLALPLSGLTSQGGSHLASWVLLSALLVAQDQKAALQIHGLDLLVRVVGTVLWPISTLLAKASAGIHDRDYFLALGLTLAYAAVLFVLAVQSFEDKDLLWPE
jgi:hypothetical protein